MKTADAEAVARLSKQLGYEVSVEQTEKNIQDVIPNENSDAFVAVHENKIVGWISVAYMVTLESSPCCEIHGLVVHEQYRKKNIGKMLIEKTKQWCKEKNCERLRLKCNVIRKEAHKFYEHLGFIEKKEQKVFEINV